MAVKLFSLKTDGARKISENFTVREFACKCVPPADEVKIDDALILALQKIRDHFNLPVTINSAYRTPAHNKKEGGSPTSQHLQGKAADIAVKGIEPLAVARYADSLGLGGVGLYTWGTHIDTRAGKSRWDTRSGKEVTVSGFGAVDYAAIVKQKAGLDDNTIAFMKTYKFADALFEKLAKMK